MTNPLTTAVAKLLHCNCMGRQRLGAFICFNGHLKLLTLKAMTSTDPKRLSQVSAEQQSGGLSSFNCQPGQQQEVQHPKGFAPDCWYFKTAWAEMSILARLLVCAACFSSKARFPMTVQLVTEFRIWSLRVQGASVPLGFPGSRWPLALRQVSP